MVQAYKLILKQEGVMRGLYAGVTPAMIGSSMYKHILSSISQKLIIVYFVYSPWNNTLFRSIRIDKENFE